MADLDLGIILQAQQTCIDDRAETSLDVSVFAIQFNVNTTRRRTLTASSNVSVGLHTIGIQIMRIGGSGTGNTPDRYVDNFAISGSATNTPSGPEPFTAIGSLIGGSVAFRMRNKLKSNI